jgi:hypothetical protein
MIQIHPSLGPEFHPVLETCKGAASLRNAQQVDVRTHLNVRIKPNRPLDNGVWPDSRETVNHRRGIDDRSWMYRWVHNSLRSRPSRSGVSAVLDPGLVRRLERLLCDRLPPKTMTNATAAMRISVAAKNSTPSSMCLHLLQLPAPLGAEVRAVRSSGGQINYAAWQ